MPHYKILHLLHHTHRKNTNNASLQDTSFITPHTFKGCKQCIITGHFIYYITNFERMQTMHHYRTLHLLHHTLLKDANNASLQDTSFITSHTFKGCKQCFITGNFIYTTNFERMQTMHHYKTLHLLHHTLLKDANNASLQDTSFITSQTSKGCKQCIITRHFIYYITNFERMQTMHHYRTLHLSHHTHRKDANNASLQDTSFITSQISKGCKQCIITGHFIYYITNFERMQTMHHYRTLHLSHHTHRKDANNASLQDTSFITSQISKGCKQCIITGHFIYYITNFEWMQTMHHYRILHLLLHKLRKDANNASLQYTTLL